MLTRTALASLTLLAASAHAGRNYFDPDVAPRALRRAPNSANKVIVQMFGWSWKSIAAECEYFLGPAGVGFVQVSPPQEHLPGDQWWVDYQVVSYQLQSKRGSRPEFAEMIGRCQKVGVKIIVDTIWNHMAGVDSGVGTAGTQFTHFNYPGLWNENDFHHCGLTKNDDIENWNDRKQLWNCELSNLADLKTELDPIRSRLAAFTNDMLSLGIDGLRLDAAKQMPPDDIRAIMSKLSRPTYLTMEIPDIPGIMSGDYVGIGDVQEFRYGEALKPAFGNGGIASLRGIEKRGWLPSNSANVFVTNHDQERGRKVLTYKSGSNAYILANVFMLSYPYGTPTILSSYAFDDINAGPPNGAFGTCYGEGGVNGWLCQHRWTAIAGMIQFYNTVGSTELNNWVQGSNQQIAFGRGNSGFVAINNDARAWTHTFKTSLPSGTYCDMITGKKSGSSCTGGKVTISNGSLNVTIPPRSAIAYHVGAKY